MLNLQVPLGLIPSCFCVAPLLGYRKKRNKVWVYDTAIWLSCPAGILSGLIRKQGFICHLTVHNKWPEGAYLHRLGPSATESGSYLPIYSHTGLCSLLIKSILDCAMGHFSWLILCFWRQQWCGQRMSLAISVNKGCCGKPGYWP